MKTTTDSLCPQCLRPIPATLVPEGDDIYMVKTCPQHGRFRTIIWRGPPAYESWAPATQLSSPASETANGNCPHDCGLCPGHRQHTCCLLLEVTGRCDLACPVCFAAAGTAGDDPDLAAVEGWLRQLMAGGGPYNIQLSGGEPTLRDDLPAIIRRGHALGLPFFQLNTNGLRLAADAAYVRELAAAGLDCVFLQFDGTDDAVYEKIRGRALLDIKTAAIARCAEHRIGVVLVPTIVPGINNSHIGAIVRFALARLPAVRGVHFQPVSYFGRFPRPPADADRFTLPELMTALERQTDGQMKITDFRPSAGRNPYCSFHANYLVAADGALRSWAGREEKCCCKPPAADGAGTARTFVARRWSAAGSRRPAAAASCPGVVTDSLDAFLDAVETRSLCISAMAFQDADTIDLARVRDCPLHVRHRDGRLIPFCAYYLTDRQGASLHRPPPRSPLDNWAAKRIGIAADGLSREQIEHYQLTRLRTTVGWAAANSPFYRALLAGRAASGLSSLADLGDLPFTTADDLRRQGPRFLSLSQSAISRVVTLGTSGTTGAAKRLYFTPADQEATIAFFRAGMAGIAAAGERVLILLPGQLPGSVGDLLATALHRLGACPVPHGALGDLAAALTVIEHKQVTCLVGIPAQVLALARWAAAAGRRPAIKSVLLSTDHVPRAIVRELERLWGCEVFEHYGMTELGLGGGTDCRAHAGYHLHEADFYFEIIDPRSGRPVPAGCEGEVVVTTLARRGMPLIRYRTGDISRIVPGPCPCGSALRRLAPIARRRDGQIALGEYGTFTLADLDEALFAVGGVAGFTAAVDSTRDARRLTLNITTVGHSGGESSRDIHQALNGVVAIEQANRAGRLAIAVAVEPCSGRLAAGPAKRAIREMSDTDGHAENLPAQARQNPQRG